MKNVITIGFELVEEKTGIGMEFESSINKTLAERIGKERQNKIEGLVSEIVDIIRRGVVEDIEKEFGVLLKDTKDEKEIEDIDYMNDPRLRELYDEMSDGAKQNVDEFMTRINNCKSKDERALVALQELIKEMERLLK
ncbi:MAG: hypothetical protein J6D12_02270 [Peptostreptococcaceae bacterium]|nr:hypothetical protein [Peptostreptococcaceae bacterium]